MNDSVKENSSEQYCQLDGAVRNFSSGLSKRKPGTSSLVGMSRLKVYPVGVSISHPSSISSFVVVTDRGASQDLSDQLRRRFSIE